MDIEKKLEFLGLTKTESSLYVTLLKIGESTAIQLAKESNIHRRTIYDNLTILIKKGFVSYKIKNKIRYFEPVNPTILQGLLNEKKNTLDDVLPTLIKLFQNKQTTPQITIIEGTNGAKSIVEEAIQLNETIYWMGGGLFFFDALGFSKDFIEKTPDILQKLKHFKKENIKILPEKYISQIGYTVYGDTVVIGLVQDKTIIAIKIVNKEFAKGFMNYFDIIWNIK
jgi:sugar-specific transcriptional regulator TrmB